MPEKFSFPGFKTVYQNAPKFKTQHLKFTLRTLWYRKEIKAFEQFVNASEICQSFFSQMPQDAYPLIHEFVDKKLGGQDRLKIMQSDFEAAEKLFGKERVMGMKTRSFHIVLAKPSDGLEIWLNRNDNCVDEGMWSLSLRESNGRRLYMTTFAFVNNMLLAASLQGPAGEEAKDTVRGLTKKLHGLRPQQLMVHALQYFAIALKLDGVIGITQDRQVKLRWRLKKRVKMNYDQFWQEHGAQKGVDGLWHLPKEPVRKDFEEIESKKRSMYRKRYQMLDEIEEQIRNGLAPIK